jgi:hypothetical protein
MTTNEGVDEEIHAMNNLSTIVPCVWVIIGRVIKFIDLLQLITTINSSTICHDIKFLTYKVEWKLIQLPKMQGINGFPLD